MPALLKQPAYLLKLMNAITRRYQRDEGRIYGLKTGSVKWKHNQFEVTLAALHPWKERSLMLTPSLIGTLSVAIHTAKLRLSLWRVNKWVEEGPESAVSRVGSVICLQATCLPFPTCQTCLATGLG